MPMRRLCLTLLCGLVVIPTAVAASQATGDGVLEFQKVDATVAVWGQRGTIWGQMDKGRLVVTDPNPLDGAVNVSGAESTTPGIADNTTIYTGKDIHFRISGKYALRFIGKGIDFAAVGIGTAKFTGDFSSLDPGRYAVDDSDWQDVGFVQRVVKFGVPAATPTP
jgi:hypothetical protein